MVGRCGWPRIFIQHIENVGNIGGLFRCLFALFRMCRIIHLDFDIAVVIINGNIKYSIFTKPIDLPKYNWHSHINEEAIVSGFGHSQVSHDKH